MSSESFKSRINNISKNEHRVASIFDWAKKLGNKLERPVVRYRDGSEQMRILTDSGFKILLSRPDSNHKEEWMAFGKSMILRREIAAKPKEPWDIPPIPEIEVDRDILSLVTLDNYGTFMTFQVNDTEESYYGIPPKIQEQIDMIFDEPWSAIPWDIK